MTDEAMSPLRRRMIEDMTILRAALYVFIDGLAGSAGQAAAELA